MVRASPSKQCASDPLPTWLLKEAITILALKITTIFNSSITEGRLSGTWRHAIVTLLLKKARLEQSSSSSYRPVSNLPFLSKVLEWIVNRQFIGYFNEFHLFPDAQSAYRRCHSTETVVLKVFSDIVDAIANGKIALLSLIYLTAAFDTVDHAILLRRLEVTYGFSSAVLQWLRSYVEDRMQSLQLNGSILRTPRVICGLPQGSVLGPLLFTLYTADIGIIVQSFGMKHHTYADDNQIYSLCFPAECPPY